MTGVDRWKKCEHGFSTSAGGEDGYALNEEGIHNRLCDNLSVVRSGTHSTVQFYEGGFKDAAELHYQDTDESAETTEALDKSCGNCQYYKEK